MCLCVSRNKAVRSCAGFIHSPSPPARHARNKIRRRKTGENALQVVALMQTDEGEAKH